MGPAGPRGQKRSEEAGAASHAPEVGLAAGPRGRGRTWSSALMISQKWFKHESKCNERVHLLSGELRTTMRGSGVQAQTWARTCRGPVWSLGCCWPQVPVPVRRHRRPPPVDPVPPPRCPGALLAAQVQDGGAGGGAAATSRCPEAGLPLTPSESLRRRRKHVVSLRKPLLREKKFFFPKIMIKIFSNNGSTNRT